MSDLIRLEHGRQPWKPTPDTELVVEYQYYDVPLSGILRQHGIEYLFACLDGENETLSLWLFIAVSPGQREALEQGEGSFAERLRNLPLPGWGRLALVTERIGIIDFEDSDGTPEGVHTALRALQQRFDDLNSDAHELQAQFC